MSKIKKDIHEDEVHENEKVEDKENIKIDQETELLKKCEEYKSGWARAQADYQNLQKEVENNKSDWIKMSELQILEEFIPIYDNFKKAFFHKPQEDNGNWENWATGIGFIMKQFQDVLKNHGVEEIETVGKKFDIELHEAAGEEESTEYKSGIIIREVDAGYTMHKKIIKAAKVIVAV